MGSSSKNVFRGIIGHKSRIRILENYLERKSFTHAYLFTGFPNLGKKEVALRFIGGILNLKDQDRVLAYPDLRILNRTKSIQINEIRELKRHLSLEPYLGSYKIGFLPEAERMTREAANALLKILEEPPDDSILILTARDRKALLETVVSRCEILKFQRVRGLEIKDFLTKKGLDSDRAELLTRLSEGRPGQAIEYLEQDSKLKQETGLAEELFRLKEQPLSSRFRFVQKMIKDGTAPESFLNIWLKVYHDILLLKLDCLYLVSGLISKRELLNLSQNYSADEVLFVLRLIGKISRDLKYNINKRLALEALMISI